MPGTDLATLQGRFRDFARTYPELPLYSAVCRGVAGDPDCAALLQAAAPGQHRPVLWLAALHDLVLREPGLPAARWYASVAGRDALPPGDPWPDVRRTVLAHQDELRALIASRTTQTNEVNRCVYLAPSLALACADRPDQPVVLVETGASAGLLLGVDRYRVELVRRHATAVLGDRGSVVRCAGEDRSFSPLAERGPPLALPPVVGRLGVDRHPVDLGDPAAVRWLEACLWPDVPGRVERFRSAVAQRTAGDGLVVEGDLVDDLPDLLAGALGATGADAHLVVFSSWALTYVDRARRLTVVATLEAAARNGRAVTWLTAEPPGCVPGLPPSGPDVGPGQTTVLGLRRWRDGRESAPANIGTAHPHGEWVQIDGR